MCSSLSKEKIAIVDLHTPFGHANLLNYYLKNLNYNKNYIILNERIKKFLDIKKCNFFNKSNFKNYLNLFFFLMKNKINKVIFLSYNPFFLVIFSFFLLKKKIKIFIIEHDTLNKKKKINFFFNKCLNKSVIRLVYTHSQKKFVTQNFENKVKIIDHPILKDNFKTSSIYNSKNFLYFKNNYEYKKKIIKILVPTRYYLDKKKFFQFTKKNKSCLFVVLSKVLKSEGNIIKIENIKNSFIKNFDFIYLPNDEKIYASRLSSWIYTSIANNKRVLLDNSTNYRYEKKRFSNFIFLANKIKIFSSKFVMTNSKHRVYIEEYNKKSMKNFLKIIHGEM
jgi:hypothetical protein